MTIDTLFSRRRPAKNSAPVTREIEGDQGVRAVVFIDGSPGFFMALGYQSSSAFPQDSRFPLVIVHYVVVPGSTFKASSWAASAAASRSISASSSAPMPIFPF